MSTPQKRKGIPGAWKVIEGKCFTYVFVRCEDGAYYAFPAVPAKAAARDCGATEGGNTRQMCKEVWGKH